jgi:hypothetical protein
MSVIKFPKWAIEAINSHMANFFSDNTRDKHRYHLSNRYSLAYRKELGGLGIPDFRDLNLCLLASWVQRYYHAERKMWKGIIERKYNPNSSNLLCCDDRGSSPFWKGYYGQQRLQRWVTDGKWGLGKESDFGNIVGLEVVRWPSNTGVCTLL